MSVSAALWRSFPTIRRYSSNDIGVLGMTLKELLEPLNYKVERIKHDF
jgi:hypothetical protein